MTKSYISGKWVKQASGYKSFEPSLINQDYLWQDSKINQLLEDASRQLGELNSCLSFIPDPNFFIHMHVMKEALSSSRIEGTRTTFDEAVMPEGLVDEDRRDDWREVQNYTYAINAAVQELNNLPLSMRLLNQAHKTLLDDVRGKHKQPGLIRKSQNWIGGSSLTDAYFIPPHYESVPELLSDMEKFIHNGTLPMPHLIKAAILHYQFETIHPYLDGNGRIGRLLIVLYLVDKNLLRKPTLYISDFFEKNRGSYYDALTLARSMNDIDQWIRFFLVAVAETAKHSTEKLIQIIHLKQALTEKLLALGSRASKANELLLFLFSKPVVDYDMVTQALAVTHPTANRLLADFQRLGILVERTGFKKNRVYSFEQYLDIFTK